MNESTTAHVPRWSTSLILLFNGALIVWLLLKPGGPGLYLAVDNVAQFVGPLLVLPLCFGKVWRRPRRWAPILLGVGVLGIALGQMIFTYYEQVLHLPSAPFPSWADASWLSSYPFLLLGILALPTRHLALAARTRVFLDGLMIMTAVVTFSWYVVLGPTLMQGADSLFAQLVSTAYPFCDLVLVFCLLVLASRVADPQVRRVVLLLQGALGLIVASDTTLAYEQLHNAYHTGSLLDVGWPLGYMLVGVAAGQLRHLTGAAAAAARPPSSGQAADAAPWWRLVLPYAFLPAVGLLVLATWPAHAAAALRLGVAMGGVVLIALVVLRQVLALLENQRLYRASAAYAQHMERLNVQVQHGREELQANNDELQAMHGELASNNRALTEANARLEALATTDALTGVLNHRAVVTTLDHELERAQRYGRPCTVLFVDLDHFKALNDNYGHAVGDTALQHVTGVLRGVLRGVDHVGRWGGEEFVALLPEMGPEEALVTAERVRTALTAQAFGRGGGTYLTASIGVATYPADGVDRDALVAHADRAMYAAKRLGRNQVRAARDPAVAALGSGTEPAGSREETALAGTVEALACLVEARDRYTGQHTHAVAALTLRVALALGLDAPEAHMVGVAARLHDVGKVAIPDAVLQKPARLTAEEWAVMRQHPDVGADVVSRVPALRGVAALVRAHHERWDGSGYPAGLAGGAIPLGARIIAVVDAYGTMTSDRPYRAARTVIWALDEVRRCAGTHFDPAVVTALDQVLAAHPPLTERAGPDDAAVRHTHAS